MVGEHWVSANPAFPFGASMRVASCKPHFNLSFSRSQNIQVDFCGGQISSDGNELWQAKAQADCLTRGGWLSSSIMAVYLWLGCDGNLDASTLFEPHIISVFVSQRIFNTKISVLVIRPVNSNLHLFRLARTWRRDDFVDRSTHGGTWVFSDSLRIEIQFRCPCGPCHPRLCHFLLDADTCPVGGFFLSFIMHYGPIMTMMWKLRSPISHSWEKHAIRRAWSGGERLMKRMNQMASHLGGFSSRPAWATMVRSSRSSSASNFRATEKANKTRMCTDVNRYPSWPLFMMLPTEEVRRTRFL